MSLFQKGMAHSWTEAALIGFGVGLVVASAGATKDAHYEGFNARTFWRSPIIGAIEAPILAKIFGWPNIALLAMATLAAERITVEAYKIQRCQMPGKFLVGEWGVPKDTIAQIPGAI